MKVELRKTGGERITGDAEGLKALRDLIDEVLEQGYGVQAGEGLPEIVLVEGSKTLLPARRARQIEVTTTLDLARGERKFVEAAVEEMPKAARRA